MLIAATAQKEDVSAAPVAEASSLAARREYPGYEAVMAGGQVFQAGPGLPLVTYGADEVLSRSERRHIFRDLAGEVLDWNLWCLSQAGNRLDLLTGEALLSLNGKLEKLGSVRISDFVREELGLSSRSGYELMRNAKALQKLPRIREAFENGLLRKSALRYLFQVVKPETEEQWLSKATSLTVRGLEEEVRRFISENSQGKEDIDFFAPGEDDEEGKAIPVSVRVPLAVAAKWDKALEVFRRMEESNLPPGTFVEALLAEYAASAAVGAEGEACEKGHEGCCSHEYSSAGGNHGACAKCHNGGEESSGKCFSDGSGVADLQGKTGNDGVKALSASGCSHEGGRHSASFHSTEAQPSGVGKPLYLCGGSPQAALGAAFLLDPDASEKDRELARQVHRDLEEVSHFWEYLPWKPVQVELPGELQAPGLCIPAPLDPSEAVSRLRKITALRHSISFYQGRLLRTLNNFGLYKDMLFLSLGHYTRERLGISKSTAYGLISLERHYLEYPEVLDLVKAGSLTPEQARLISRVLDEGTELKGEWLSFAGQVPVSTLSCTVDAFLRYAEKAPHRKWRVSPETLELAATGRATRKVSLAEEEVVTLGKGERGCAWKVTGGSPSESRSLQFFQKFAQASQVDDLPPGEHNEISPFEMNVKEAEATIRFFLAADLVPLWNHAVMLWGGDDLTLFIEALLDTFLATWDPSPEKRDLHSRILRRDNFQCQVPGCTCRRGLHIHHIIYRSRGGSNIESNLITLCMAHHLRCVHEGHLIIRGQAPHNLTFVVRAS
ncbi:MAG: HNH endonuclease [Candidatus Eremiobacteraeota bacterium]|nr:HNH endonuclease [Candidatus Eremiobacteraeota bacterium]